MNFLIRKAVPEELTAVQSLAKQLFESDSRYDRLLDCEWPFGAGAEFYRRRIVDEDCATFIAFTGSEPVGYICGCLREFEDWRPVRRAELDNMFVRHEFRGQGVGRALYRAFADWVLSKGVSRIAVSVYFSNLNARQFYTKNGFREQLVFLEAILK